jgi:hypothetical protein
MFDSPMMQYDDYWIYNLEADRIHAYKVPEHEEQIANSERLLLALWRSHFSGTGGDPMQQFNMKHSDERNQAKILYFLSLASSFQFS